MDNPGGLLPPSEGRSVKATKEPWYRQQWVIFLAGFMVGGLIVTAGRPELASVQRQLGTVTRELQAVTQERDELKARLSEPAAPPAAAVTTAPAPKPARPTPTTISDGVYKVGTDMQAGTYKGTTISDSGYWRISTDANGDDIVANDIVTSSFYLTVKKGQYLKLVDVEIRKAD